jgi:hypothetical protein
MTVSSTHACLPSSLQTPPLVVSVQTPCYRCLAYTMDVLWIVLLKIRKRKNFRRDRVPDLIRARCFFFFLSFVSFFPFFSFIFSLSFLVFSLLNKASAGQETRLRPKAKYFKPWVSAECSDRNRKQNALTWIGSSILRARPTFSREPCVLFVVDSVYYNIYVLYFICFCVGLIVGFCKMPLFYNYLVIASKTFCWNGYFEEWLCCFMFDTFAAQWSGPDYASNHAQVRVSSYARIEYELPDYLFQYHILARRERRETLP